MFSNNWRDERIKSLYNNLSLKELIRLSGLCKNAYQEVWAYISIPKNLVRILNDAPPLDIQKFIDSSFQPDSARFQTLKQSISIPYLQKLTGNGAAMPSMDAMCCYLIIADRSEECSVLNADLAYKYAKENGYDNIANSIQIILKTVQFHASGNPQSISIQDNTYINLSYRNLSYTNLYLVDAAETIHCKAPLTGANFKKANLKSALLTNANLTCANLTDADMTNAEITGANFTDANLTRTRFFFYHESENKSSLNNQLNEWETRLAKNPQKNVYDAIINDLICIANELSFSEGKKILEIAYQHAMFQPNDYVSVKNSINSIYKLFSHTDKPGLNLIQSDYQEKLAKAILQLDLNETNKHMFGLDYSCQ